VSEHWKNKEKFKNWLDEEPSICPNILFTKTRLIDFTGMDQAPRVKCPDPGSLCSNSFVCLGNNIFVANTSLISEKKLHYN
jgi:hypothetical protein